MTMKTILGISLAMVMLLGSVPFGFSEPLKVQLENNTSLENIQCNNDSHVLVIRTNGNYACVSEKTALKTGWETVQDYPVSNLITANSNFTNTDTKNENVKILTISSDDDVDNDSYLSELYGGTNVPPTSIYPKFKMSFPDKVKLGDVFTVTYEYTFIEYHKEDSNKIAGMCNELACGDKSIFLRYPSNVQFLNQTNIRSDVPQITNTIPSITYNRDYIDGIYDNSTDQLVKEISFVFENPTNDLYRGSVYISTSSYYTNDKFYFYIGSDENVYFTNDRLVFDKEFNSRHPSNTQAQELNNEDSQGLGSSQKATIAPRLEYSGVEQIVPPDEPTTETPDELMPMSELAKMLPKLTSDKSLYENIMIDMGLSSNYIEDFFNQYSELRIQEIFSYLSFLLPYAHAHHHDGGESWYPVTTLIIPESVAVGETISFEYTMTWVDEEGNPLYPYSSVDPESYKYGVDDGAFKGTIEDQNKLRNSGKHIFNPDEFTTSIDDRPIYFMIGNATSEHTWQYKSESIPYNHTSPISGTLDITLQKPLIKDVDYMEIGASDIVVYLKLEKTENGVNIYNCEDEEIECEKYDTAFTVHWGFDERFYFYTLRGETQPITKQTHLNKLQEIANQPMLILPILAQEYTDNVYAQLVEDSITVQTDKSSYSNGDVIRITGEVRDLYSGTPVSVIVKAPNNNLVSIAQVDIGADKKFSTEITAGGPLMKIKGTYTLTAQYGTANQSAQITFEIYPRPCDIMICEGGFFSQSLSDLDMTYEISGGKVLNIIPNVDKNSLIVSIDGINDGSVILDIPRNEFDSVLENGSDDIIIVIIDGEKVDYSEITSNTHRILTIPFPAGTEEIEIIGTFVIPEFGSIAMMILVVSIISIVVITTKSRVMF